MSAIELLPAVRERLGEKQLLLIGGERVAAQDGRAFETLDPATERPLTEVAFAGAADVDAAVAAAREAFAPGGEWRQLSPAARGERITRLAELLERDGELFAQLESLDNGKPAKFAQRVDVAQAVAHLRYFGGWPTKIDGRLAPVSIPKMMTYTERVPIGVCGQVIPWNYPLLMATWKIAPALAAGCTVVLKPAEQTPLTALLLGELALEAGIPGGVLNVVAGDGSTGKLLVEHPGVDKVAFTGSTEVGRQIGASAGGALKAATLELGGKSPNIILPDADLEAAVKGSFLGIYFNAGQACNAASRLFAPAELFDQVVEALADQAAKTTPGHGLDSRTLIGPLVSSAQHERVSEYIATGREEGELVAGGGTDLGEGYFVEPTLFTNAADDARIVREEIFGPVLVAQPYDSLEEVAARANETEYGLAAGVWTRDLSNAHRLASLLEAGSVYVNAWGLTDPSVPFGGFKASGVGREHGPEGLDAYLTSKSVFIQL
jgi:acyl-CoA reductase-like NAD-dependent aldehyde dehydrogenase